MLVEVADGMRLESMVIVMFVVKMEEEAVGGMELLRTAGEDVALGSRVMLGNSMERGIATLMPMARAMDINCMFQVSIKGSTGTRL